MKIQVIEAKDLYMPTKKRVAAYARVSSEDEHLAHSLAAQIEHYRDFICENPQWEYAGMYSDGFISGTSTDSRAGFQRLMQDCRSGKIDIILCKSISRFSRNTVDLLRACRELKNIGIDIQFEKEGISTLSDDGELMLSLLASFAQEESRSISENIKWGIRKGFEVGRSTHYKLYGYSYDGKKYSIVPEQAEIVKRIYETFLSGGTAEQLEKAFLDEGIKGPKGGTFKATTIRRMLTNVTYTGNSILQREYIEDNISHKRMKNNGELAKYVVENTHPVIIPQKLFDEVQDALKRRSRGVIGNWSTGRLVCAVCGSNLRYMKKKGKNGNSISGCFICNRKSKKGAAACASQQVPEKAFMRAFSEVMGGTEFTEEFFTENVAKVIADNGHLLQFELLDGRLVTTTWEGETSHA